MIDYKFTDKDIEFLKREKEIDKSEIRSMFNKPAEQLNVNELYAHLSF